MLLFIPTKHSDGKNNKKIWITEAFHCPHKLQSKSTILKAKELRYMRIYSCVMLLLPCQLPALMPKIRTLCMFGNLATTKIKTAIVFKMSIGCW